MRDALKALLLTTAVGGIAIGAPGCSAADDGNDTSENDAVVNVSDAKVALCEKDEGSGCDPCGETIGDYKLTADERKACTLEGLRGPLKDRVNYLMAAAGRAGFFMRTGSSPDSPFRLERIKVVPDVGGPTTAKSEYTSLSGSFTTSKDPNASGVKGGVSVYSQYMPVRFLFQFVDKKGNEIRQEPFHLENSYGLIPFFYLKTEAAVNLNVGSILGKFGGGPVGSALLSALGGEASLHVEAKNEVKWWWPVCADSYADNQSAKSPKAKNEKDRRAFDNDFYQNVMKPVCMMYKKDNNANVDCWESRSFDFSTLIEKSLPMADRKILALQNCSIINDPVIGENTYEVAFVAPTAWGFAEHQKGYLYIRNDNSKDVWSRDNELEVIGVDQKKCGNRDLKDDETCVYAKLKKAFFNGVFGIGESSCADIAGTGERKFGMAQTDGDDPRDATIHYTLSDP